VQAETAPIVAVAVLISALLVALLALREARQVAGTAQADMRNVDG